MGIVAEVPPGERPLERPWHVARELEGQNPIVLRNTRLAVTQHLKTMLLEQLEYGLLLESQAAISTTSSL